MSTAGVIKFSEVLKTVSTHPSIKNGCLIDNSILFAASYPPDKYNQESEGLIDFLAELEIPIFTNVNIRSEFMNKQRQVMIPEGLSDLYTSADAQPLTSIKAKLKSAYTSISEARTSGKRYDFDENQIKSWRKLLRQQQAPNGDGWLRFCSSYLQGKIEALWENTCHEFGINFISLRNADESELVVSDVRWEDVALIIGKFGIASSDAMIINLFLNTKLSAIITADEEIAYVIEQIKPPGKFVIVPDSLHL